MYVKENYIMIQKQPVTENVKKFFWNLFFYFLCDIEKKYLFAENKTTLLYAFGYRNLSFGKDSFQKSLTKI